MKNRPEFMQLPFPGNGHSRLLIGMPFLAPLLFAAAPVAAQAPTPAAPAQQAFTSHHSGRMFISPMGEPFRPNGRDDDGLADWFRQADANHDGQLTIEEMQKDAERFFATLDVNHDGEIDPDEITRYENVVAPEIQSGRFTVGSMESPDGGGHYGGGGHHRGGGGEGFFRGGSNDQHQGAGRYGLLDLPEPVMSADSDFNRGVSLSEFRAAAAQRFLALDLDHKGYLTLPALELIRPAPPAAPKIQKPKDDTDQSPDPG
jgi:hypothetical protein